jgi:hypothetical protein
MQAYCQNIAKWSLHIPPTALKFEVVSVVRKCVNFHKQENSVGRSPRQDPGFSLADASKFNSTKMIKIVTNMAHLSQLFLNEMGIIYLTICIISGK